VKSLSRRETLRLTLHNPTLYILPIVNFKKYRFSISSVYPPWGQAENGQNLTTSLLPPLPKQTMSLKFAELHELYSSVTREDAIAIANLGAICWSSFKDGLYSQWANTMTSEEAEKATLYKEEGRKEGERRMLDSFKARLAAVDTLQTELSIANGALEQLRQSMDVEAVKRAKVLLATQRSEFEIEKMKEISALKEQIAAASLSEQMVSLLKENNESLKEKIVTLEAAREELLMQKTKSSHSIGKIGEGMVFDLLSDITKVNFPYSTVKDMTTVVHAADFHVWIMRPSGKRIKMLVDSKKYSKAVNSAEVAKLNKDIDADEEARCGLLISLDSSICATDQFEIKTTAKCKPVLFLTLQDMNYERRREMLVWAIQTLMTLVGEEDPAEKSRMLEQIDDFLHEINASLKDIDGVIKMQQKAVEGLRAVRASLTEKMKEFSGEESLDTIEHVGPAVEGGGPCGVVLKATGSPCGKPSVEGSAKCRKHTSSRSKKAGL
jgi:hypothetical protein